MIPSETRLPSPSTLSSLRRQRRLGPALVVLFWMVASLQACGGGEPPAPPSAEPAEEAEAPEETVEGPLVLFLGDSLTAGFGLAEEQAFPALLADRLEEEGIVARLVNAGVSGDTSAGGLARLEWLLRQEPDLVVLELGANDGLRGLPLEQTEENLRRIVERSREAGAAVLLVGMRIPPSYGPAYERGFAEIFPKLAEELDLPLVPFLLEGVAAVPELNLPDGIHPNAAGQEKVAEVVLPYLRPIVEELAGRDSD